MCRVKDSGESKCQQDESPEENAVMRITRWIGANALSRKRAKFRLVINTKKAQRGMLDRAC